MKRIIALTLAVIVMTAIAIPLFAADINEVGSQSAMVDITYGVQEGYTVTVPSSVDFPAGSLYTSADIEAKDVIIGGNQVLQVKISSAEEIDPDKVGGADPVDKTPWTMIESSQNGSAALPYKVSDTQITAQNYTSVVAFQNDDVVLEVVSNQEDGEGNITLAKSTTLYFGTQGTSQSGNYIDVLTFTAVLADAN